jgi:hypothetical protein
MTQFETFKIVVASPNDVQDERKRLEEVARDLNVCVAPDRGLDIKIIRWETDSYPGFHVNGPQGLIDPILDIRNCDLLVGVFWKKFGTHTMSGETGTEHEIRTAYESWKQKDRPGIMVYFREKPDPRTQLELDQVGRILDFQKNFPREGLWWPYKNARHFEQLVRQHITKYIREKKPLVRQRSTIIFDVCDELIRDAEKESKRSEIRNKLVDLSISKINRALRNLKTPESYRFHYLLAKAYYTRGIYQDCINHINVIPENMISGHQKLLELDSYVNILKGDLIILQEQDDILEGFRNELKEFELVSMQKRIDELAHQIQEITDDEDISERTETNLTIAELKEDITTALNSVRSIPRRF